jgi:hypothetical protein
MPKFTFISEDLDLNGYKTGSKLTKEFTCETLDAVVREFDMFIRGTGYSFSGEIAIVPEEEIVINDDNNFAINEYEYDPSNTLGTA